MTSDFVKRVTGISQKTNLHKITLRLMYLILEYICNFTLFPISVVVRDIQKNRKGAIPFQHFLTFRGHIINVCRRIQLLAGQTIDDETAKRVFPSFVWLLRDVVLHLPKGIENLKKYFLEKVMFENAVMIIVAFSEFLLHHDRISRIIANPES